MMITLPHSWTSSLFWKGSQRTQTHKLLSTFPIARTLLSESMRHGEVLKKTLKYMVRNLINLICINWSCQILQGCASSPRQLILFGWMAALCYSTPPLNTWFYFRTFTTTWMTLMGGSRSSFCSLLFQMWRIQCLQTCVAWELLEKSVQTHLS